MQGNYCTIREIADSWGITVRRVQILCTEGRIPGAFKKGRTWLIPEGTERPDDRRVKTNEFGEKYFTSEMRDKDLELLYSFLHEMRQNVSTIMGFSELAESHISDEKLSRRYIDNISSSSNELLEMTNNFMTIIQIERGEIEPSYEVVSNFEFSDTFYSKLERKARDRRIIVRYTHDVTHDFVYSDKVLAANFIDTLVNFMVKSTQYGGSINVKVSEEDTNGTDSCIMRFAITIAGGNQGRDFEKYKRTNIMFLAVKRIVDLIGGHFIDVYDNYRPDNYSYTGSDMRVIFEIPLRLAMVSGIEKPEAVKVDPEKYRGMRILIAEDNELNRMASKMIFEDEGFKVETAEDGIFAVAMIERAIPYYYDAVFMDLQMPNVNGVTATKLIRGLKEKSKSSVPVFAMTANVSEKDRREAMSAGMNGFLEKPLDLNKFYRLMAEFENRG